MRACARGCREGGQRKGVAARRIGKDEKEVRRILDPWHQTKLGTLSDALKVLGRQMVIAVEEMA